MQENERQQIALYLHDHVVQELSSLKIVGESLAAEDSLAGCQDVRCLSYDLLPPGLEQIGLASAVSDCCREFSRKSGIPVKYSKAGINSLQLEFAQAINIYLPDRAGGVEQYRRTRPGQPGGTPLDCLRLQPHPPH